MALSDYPYPAGRVQSHVKQAVGLEQVLPAIVQVQFQCVLCDLVETEHVQLSALGNLKLLGTHYKAQAQR